MADTGEAIGLNMRAPYFYPTSHTGGVARPWKDMKASERIWIGARGVRGPGGEGSGLSL